MLTVIACVNAAGDRIPPHIIEKWKTIKALHGFDVQSAPQGTTKAGQNKELHVSGSNSPSWLTLVSSNR